MLVEFAVEPIRDGKKLVDGVTGRPAPSKPSQASRPLATALFGGALRGRLAWQSGGRPSN
jgi:hypothetical protein